MAFYIKRPNQELAEISDARAIVDLVPEMAQHFDQFAADRKIQDSLRTPSTWGPLMSQASEYVRVARIPTPLWTKMARMAEEGIIPDPLKDDRFFYGWLKEHPEYQSYTVGGSHGNR